MKIYEVGGAVRDRLLQVLNPSIIPNDRDWVVVGATPEEMLRLGFKPVGNDFPVFLHPKTHEEYALARTERKTSRGYHGFSFYTEPDVTLEEDLKRRDLTINAMALDKAGVLIDPFGGKDDLQKKIFRHVSDAFSEDPVRILRVARFAARFVDFSIANETQALMRGMVKAGETDALVAERVWAELARGLMEEKPSRMLTVLIECGYWERSQYTIPVDSLTLDALDESARQKDPLTVRAAILFENVKDTSPLRALRVPNDIIDLVNAFLKNASLVNGTLSVDSANTLFEAMDPVRRPERFELFLTLSQRLKAIDPAPWLFLKEAYVSLDAGAIAKSVPQNVIALEIRRARQEAVTEAFKLIQGSKK